MYFNSLKIQSKQKMHSLSEKEIKILRNQVNFSQIGCEENVKISQDYHYTCREQFALKTGSFVLYLPDEVEHVRRAEEAAALKAAPEGYALSSLNGLNIGCGDRRIDDALIPIDIMRTGQAQATGSHHAFLGNAILANPEDLPFKPKSLDFIVALHMLEHIANPIEILKYWASLLKPGGGIGLILPNFQYTWNAKADQSQFGHKWNASAEMFTRLYEKHLTGILELEQIETLPYKISFDVVLRKPGTFEPFKISDVTSPCSGAELARRGLMVE